MTMSAPSFTLPVTVTLERSLDSQVKRGVDNFMRRCSRVVSSTTLSSHQTWNQDAVPSTEFKLQPRGDDEFDTAAEAFFCFLRLEWCKVPVFGLGWLTADEEANAFSKSERNTPAHSDIRLKTFALGAFQERSTFIIHYDASAYGSPFEDDASSIRPAIRLELERQVTFEHDRKQLAVHFKPSEDEGVHKFEVDYDNLESYILVYDSYVQTGLYFFLKHPLKVDRYFFQKLRTEEERFGARFAEIDTALHQLLAMRDIIMEAEQVQFPAAHRTVRRVFVTPTRLMFMHPEIVRDNRILRKYGEDNFMRVSIRDEDFGKLQAVGWLAPGEEETFTHVNCVLQDGMKLGDRNYEFLAASNSQLREHNVWFFASDGKNTAESIRREMGDFSHIRCPATVLARMGQCFSNTEPSVVAKTSDREVVRIPEKEAGENPVYCFSDGIGKISQSLAQKVHGRRTRGETEVPSAYQIRYGGIKGVVAVDPYLPGDVMQVRPSMIKFMSSDENIEICMTSHPARLYLNRQVITILSALGVPDLNFQNLQETMLQNLSDMLVSEHVAFKSLKRRAQPFVLPLGKLSRCGLHITTEPFFRAMLQKMFTCFLGQLRRKARIEIPPEYGRNMLGVLDETGTLEYGEVFVQYTEDIADKSSRARVLTDNVVVTRNPCFHPGDVRKLRAVDVPKLHHMVDVIVFPSKGQRPHPNEMSGGDLDGDEYFVTWYPDLIFPRPNLKPMDFTSQGKKLLPSVETQDIKDFIVEYIKNDILGQIANAHLASAHTLPGGIFSSKCLGLAKKHSDAVDFPKTGVCPSLEKDERPLEYPDFMGKKKGKTTRRSESVQGKMYRECQTIERVCSHLHEDKDIGSQTVEVDQAFIHQDHKKYTVSSHQARDQYNERLQDLMNQYGIATEAEAVSGCIVRMRPHMEDRYERFEAERIAKDRIAHLRKQTRQEFFHDFGGEENVDLDHCPEKVMAKASAWYISSYSMGNPGLLSFPWVVADVLAELKIRTTDIPSLVQQPIVDRITNDLAELYGTQFYTTFMNLMDPKDDGHSRRDHVLMYMRRYATVIHLVSFLLQWGKEHCSQLNRTDLLFLFTTYAVNQGFFEDLGMPTRNETVELQIFLRRTKENDFYNSLSILGGKATGELCISFLKYLSSHEFMEMMVTFSCDIPVRLSLLPRSAKENLHAKALVAYHLLAQTGDIWRLTSTTDTNKEILWEWGMEIPPNLWDQHFYRRMETREQELLRDTGVQEVHVRLLRRVRGPYRGHLSAVGTEESINELQLVMENLIDRFKNMHYRRPWSRRR
ncbi:PREDICTED: LOW QUALITY PROTEIN: probable RNA-dependent RNA polymerase 1 [Branchiostoma belcheri]|uniref:RNA-dependent RNA polymerase n=1 Tax=Branchiostoma belcheri TaxID=7741 RepID=A0A6P4ZKU4_BRABE|nr:PREDICTED: LOW QUALITY PROTEIN: probable RNA-dependent RNA polymerase 1 [Branchiostoma belcheri]